MNLIPPYFITVTRAEEGPLAGKPYNVNPDFLILSAPMDGGGARIIVNALVFYDAATGRTAHLEMAVRESPEEIQQMIDAAHERAAGEFLDFQNALAKGMTAQTEMLERERVERITAAKAGAA